ncbi:heme ABC transporter substrate-binding protein IsdE [Paenibacillus macerans]|uniref:heme ABC transporter substrate-binding protein IsdE n=1 Tax=Paenibacillus macerans TaxID=44252 RepID=UPI00203B5B22|nr:heme ABC transporter substrate-binding protein IsdE [Paenibacillus macerans]MCM3701195.1 heme ABC transporter substrate-binding protein IsdE [Paenibacillus macerans]
MRTAVGVICSLALLCLLWGCSSGQAAERANQTGSAETASAEPKAANHRIVATTVAITEIMDALGVELIGIPTSSKELPERYAGVTEVGNPMNPNMEIIKGLAPTEVLSVTTLQYDLKPVFANAGIEARFLDLTSLERMEQAILELGEQYDRQEAAGTLVASMNDKLKEIKGEVADRPAPTVLILLGVPGSYLVATEHSYIGDLVARLGGKNIVQGEKVEYLASNTEYLQQANPDIILRAAHGMPDEVVEMFNEEFQTNTVWKHFSAVQNSRVYDLEERLFGTTGNLAAAEALEDLKTMMYP